MFFPFAHVAALLLSLSLASAAVTTSSSQVCKTKLWEILSPECLVKHNDSYQDYQDVQRYKYDDAGEDCNSQANDGQSNDHVVRDLDCHSTNE